MNSLSNVVATLVILNVLTREDKINWEQTVKSLNPPFQINFLGNPQDILKLTDKSYCYDIKIIFLSLKPLNLF